MSDYERLCKRSAEAHRATMAGHYLFWAMNVDNPQNRPLTPWYWMIGGSALALFLS